MLPLLFAAVFFFFLLVGAVIFLLCVLIPPARRYALSAALWFAFLGLCTNGLIVCAGAAAVASSFLTRASGAASFDSPLPTGFGWSFLILGAVFSAVVSTAVAWTHQLLIRRMTFHLFRIYATVVSAGIGSVFGWVFGWWMISQHIPLPGLVLLWGFGMPVLVTSFGWSACNGARALRGEAPTKFTWISREEFDGV